MLYKYRFLFYGFLILIFGLSFGLLYISLNGTDDRIDYDPNTKELNGVFSVYEGKVYAMVPSNGYFEVKGAHPETFKTIPNDYSDSHIGYDDRYVYAGNIILKGLNPNKLKILGNNYYTDGTTTYYCARNSERNEHLSGIGFILRLAGQSLGIADKPQDYWYPFVELPKHQAYESRPGFATAASADKAFYKGLELPQADPKNIRPIQIHYWDGDKRDSEFYRTDGKRVYYENQLLPLTYNPSIYEIGIKSDLPSRNVHLTDPKNGMIYADGHSFDLAKAPYRLISENLEHANQAIFAARDGLYFYNSESEKVEKASDNPFQNSGFKEIAPDVFSSGNRIYYLAASEHWGRKTGLQSRSTHLLELENVEPSGLKKISSDAMTYGSVWQSGNRFYYFDDLGSSQLMPSAVYEIREAATAQYLINSVELRPDDIRQLSSSGKLSEAKGKKIATATTPFGNDWYNSYWIIFGGIAFVLLIVFLMRNKRVDPYLIKDGYLIINNLLFTKYKITDIDKIIFRVERSIKGGGYGGRMQIKMKNGKTSRNTVFSTKVTLAPESEATVKTYINVLREELAEEGIRSELDN
jgi:hypothetical protein